MGGPTHAFPIPPDEQRARGAFEDRLLHQGGTPDEIEESYSRLADTPYVAAPLPADPAELRSRPDRHLPRAQRGFQPPKLSESLPGEHPFLEEELGLLPQSPVRTPTEDTFSALTPAVDRLREPAPPRQTVRSSLPSTVPGMTDMSALLSRARRLREEYALARQNEPEKVPHIEAQLLELQRTLGQQRGN